MSTTTSTDSKASSRARNKADQESLNDLLRPVRGRLRLAQVCQTFASALSVAPYVAVAEIGAVLSSGHPDAGRVWWLLSVCLSMLGGSMLLNTLALLICHLADVDLIAHNQRRMIATIGRAPLGWFSKSVSGRVRKALDDDTHDVHYLVAHASVESLAALLSPAFALAYIAIFLDWRLALVALIPFPVYGIALATMMHGTSDKMTEMNAAQARISAAITELVSGVAVIKAFGRTGQAHAAYRDAVTDFGRFYRDWMQPMLRTEAWSSMALTQPLVLMLNLGLGGWMVHAGWVTPVMVITSTLVAMVIPPVLLSITGAWYSRQLAAQAASRIRAVLDTEQLQTLAVPPVDEAPGTVRFDHVSFGYDDNPDVLHDVDLTCAPGRMTALVGPSGSGKSTLAALALRFHDARSGSIRVSGHDVRSLSAQELYRQVGFVLQDVVLLGIPLVENIRLARPDATDDEVIAAAKAAQIHDVITALPEGYASVAGQNAELSGGERQRIQIARAILADPGILVLDEATSFADPDSEAAIQRALAPLLRDRTLIVIAHRLETIRHADSIVVLDEGRVVEQGTHDTLLHDNGLYAQLWNSFVPPTDKALA